MKTLHQVLISNLLSFVSSFLYDAFSSRLSCIKKVGTQTSQIGMAAASMGQLKDYVNILDLNHKNINWSSDLPFGLHDYSFTDYYRLQIVLLGFPSCSIFWEERLYYCIPFFFISFPLIKFLLNKNMT